MDKLIFLKNCSSKLLRCYCISYLFVRRLLGFCKGWTVKESELDALLKSPRKSNPVSLAIPEFQAGIDFGKRIDNTYFNKFIDGIKSAFALGCFNPEPFGIDIHCVHRP
ncbi:MAG: hypothetical protein ACRYFR_13330 [Janthinobacterium lividum]